MKFLKHWKSRLIDLLLSKVTARMLKFAGVYMIYFTCLYHFDINFNVWESLLIGVGLGLIVE